MDVVLDPLMEPMRCAHGRQFIAGQNGELIWLDPPCAACEVDSVAQRQPAHAA